MRLNEQRSGAPLRVLHMPWNVAGQASALAAAEREVGLDSRSVALEPGRFGFEADETICPTGQSAFARERARWALLKRALREADVVHYNWGETLFTPPAPGSFGKHQGPLRSRLAMGAAEFVRGFTPFHDLAVLKRAGKVIAVTFQGDDIRQGDRQQARYSHSLADVVAPGYYSAETDAWKRRSIRAFDQHADLLYALNPDLLHDLPARARFLPYATVDPLVMRPTPAVNQRLVVAHAPSDRRVKGTEHVVEAVEQARAAGLDFDFMLIEGASHEDARRQLSRADIIIDQLHAGFYGAVSVEAMALGKTVMCFLRSQDLDGLPAAMKDALPLLNVSVATLTEALVAVLREPPEARDARGARSRAFAETWHDPRRVAARTRADYEAAAANPAVPLPRPA